MVTFNFRQYGENLGTRSLGQRVPSGSVLIALQKRHIAIA